MKEFIAANGGIVPTILVASLVMNAVLSGLYVILGKLKEMTESKVDNAAWKIIGALLDGLHKVTEILSANPQHK